MQLTNTPFKVGAGVCMIEYSGRRAAMSVDVVAGLIVVDGVDVAARHLVVSRRGGGGGELHRLISAQNLAVLDHERFSDIICDRSRLKLWPCIAAKAASLLGKLPRCPNLAAFS